MATEAVITLKEGISLIDWGTFIKELIEREWQQDNTDSHKPKVYFAEINKQYVFPDGDHITIYSNSAVPTPLMIGHIRINEYEAISLDMFTSRDRTHLIKMIGEVERIINSHRNDPLGITGAGGVEPRITGRLFITPGRKTSFDRTSRNFYRRTIEFECNWRMKEVRT